MQYYHSVKPKLKYKEILNIINQHHDKVLTFRTLKRICKHKGLNRCTNVDPSLLADAINIELGSSLSLVGYRQMAENLNVKYGINTSRESVRKILKILDPVGVENRKRKLIRRRIYISDGPADIFHIDGNDKLKKWGFPIHGCVDGFSRKIMWLVASTTNNDPLVVANHFLHCIRIHGIAPRLLRMDRGNENIYCQDIQTFFTGNESSYLYAASTHNQRIEALWSRLKKFRISWWIQFFTAMEKHGLFKPSLEIHKEVLLFCFMPVIQSELNEFTRTWNMRNVRQSANGPGGKPDILFQLPSSVGFTNQGIAVEASDIDVANDVLGIECPPVFKNEDLNELCLCYTQINNFALARDADGALDVYVNILNCFEQDCICF